MAHLAQLNIARLRRPLDHADTAEFVAALDGINLIAEASEGFVWRLKDEDGQSSSYVEVYDDPLVIVNLSVWRDAESLRHFMYKSGHVAYLRRRTEWFEPANEATAICWWIDEGTVPDAHDAAARLERFRREGVGEWGFGLNALPRAEAAGG